MAYFQVFGDRPALYQWDTGRRVIVDCDCQEVHFSNALDGEALVVETYTDDGTKYANIPNILLQAALPLNVYAYVCSSERYTQRAVVLEVNPRSKPADYVYTETEVKNYDALAARIKKLEESGAGVDPEQLQEAVDMALEQAKESGEFEGEPGKPGTTPHIGANGNWYIGDTDTGVKAAGSDASVTADSIREALGYTPASDELAAIKPTFIQAEFIESSMIAIDGYTLGQLDELAEHGEIIIAGMDSEGRQLVLKCYSSTMGSGTLYTIEGGGEKIRGTDCLVGFKDMDGLTVGEIRFVDTVISESVKTEIAEQAAGLVDMALLAIIGEVTE